ncbi:MAG: 1-acyl-sn-glycerol-3-phosphate acyltransferase [Myxococcales bacterium]|nr:1-acyl-sn-glycerol-3-phosphate acyltransferase [Myxococcales bacterium]
MRFARAFGWEFAGERPPFRKYVLIAGPHTSTWDLILTMALLGHFRIPLRFMVKQSLSWWPLGAFLKLLGAIRVNRSAPSNQVARTVATLREHDDLVIGVLPEGTRERVQYWRTGFYYIARGAEVPIVMARLDAPQRRLTIGGAFWPTADEEADFARVAAYFDGAIGFHPERSGPVRFKPGEG